MTSDKLGNSLLLLGYVSGLMNRDGTPYYRVIEADAASRSALVKSQSGNIYRLAIEPVEVVA